MKLIRRFIKWFIYLDGLEKRDEILHKQMIEAAEGKNWELYNLLWEQRTMPYGKLKIF